MGCISCPTNAAAGDDVENGHRRCQSRVLSGDPETARVGCPCVCAMSIAAHDVRTYRISVRTVGIPTIA